MFNDISDQLSLIGEFMKSISDLPASTPANTVNPLVPLFQQLWPFIERILTEFSRVDDIVESSCRLVKHAQRAMGTEFAVYLQPFITQALTGYQLNPIGSYVYGVEFCFTDFGKMPQYKQMFVQAFDFICKQTNLVLHSKEECAKNPDLVNDFFGIA